MEENGLVPPLSKRKLGPPNTEYPNSSKVPILTQNPNLTYVTPI